LLVGEQRHIPARREPAPHGHEPRFVERIDDEQDNRNVEKGKAQHQRDDVEAAELSLHVSAPFPESAPVPAGRTSSARRGSAAAAPPPPRPPASRGWRRTPSTAS